MVTSSEMAMAVAKFRWLQFRHEEMLVELRIAMRHFTEMRRRTDSRVLSGKLKISSH